VLKKWKTVFVLLLLLSGAASAATLVTRDGRELVGKVKSISESGVVISTNQGVLSVPPDEVESLWLDGPWILGFADGERKQGRLEVSGGSWYLNGERFNFYSVYAFAPVGEAASRDTDRGGRESAGNEWDEAPPASGAAEAGADGLLAGRLRVAGRDLSGRLLAITPDYLVLQPVGGKPQRFETAGVEELASKAPWTVVASSGGELTGRLTVSRGEWRIGGKAFDPETVAAFVLRLDLVGANAAPAPAEEPESVQPVGEEAESSREKVEASGEAVEICPDPDSLKRPAATDVADWSLRAALGTGRDFEDSGDLAEAVRIYRQVLASHPEEANAWLYLGLAYRKLAAACEREGEGERADRYYQQAERVFSDGAARVSGDADKKLLRYWLARVRQEGAWGREAAESFEKGYAAYQREDFGAAADDFGAAAAASPDWPDAYYWQARALLNLGKDKEAAAALRRALQADPDFKPAQDLLLSLGEVGEKVSLSALLKEAYQKEVSGDLDGARDLYLQAVRRFPDSFEAHYRLGLLDRKLGRWDEARVMLERAAELADPEHARMVRYWLGRLPKDAAHGITAVDYFEKGYAAYTRGDYRQAAEYFEKADESAGGWTDALYWRARSLIKLGQTDEARRLLEEVLRLDPEHAGASTLLRELK